MTDHTDEPRGQREEEESMQIEIDPAKLERFRQQLRDNENLLVGTLGGVAAATVGAVLWAVITAVTGYQIGFMAIAIGFIVGFAVRSLGHGISMIFGIVGAVLALAGCVAGNIFAVSAMVAKNEGLSVFYVLSQLDVPRAWHMLKVTFSPMDLIFYAIAVYEGYKFSFRRITGEELMKLAK
jgi:hypothetical protein